MKQTLSRLFGNDEDSRVIDTITTPGAFAVSVKDYGEEEPGAHEIRFQLSVPLEGVDVIRSTNGTGFYDDALERVYLYDSCLILEIDPKSRQCRHKNHHARWGFQRFERRGDRFHFVYLCEGGEQKEEDVSYGEIYWHTGMGYASQGKFPSAPISWKLANRRFA